MSGKGKYTYSGNSTYEGDWENSQMQGTGVYIFANGNKYEGEFQNDMKHGTGELLYINGERYVGEWERDVANGKGRLNTSGDVFEGLFRDGKRTDKVHWITKTVIDMKVCGKQIVHVVRALFYHNGNAYKGNWVDDKRHGYGILEGMLISVDTKDSGVGIKGMVKGESWIPKETYYTQAFTKVP